ncbi:transposase [Vibrio crassostreae]|nr:transposase [Vibrio crassostreae]CAK2738190.1 transposase [Vibrio crassostreae]CAK2933030.1 transposase [Vibrio crassostreae]CAK2966702.1 transposase [Vibrio crassostreae]CAK3233461.1 transposase [Vibrio crassostreae]
MFKGEVGLFEQAQTQLIKYVYLISLDHRSGYKSINKAGKKY